MDIVSKITKSFCKGRISKLTTILMAIFGIGTLFRVLKRIIEYDHYVDFTAYYDISSAILNNLNPYNLNNLISWPWDLPPIVLPSYIVLFAPFTWIDLEYAKYIYLIINLILPFVIFFSYIRKTSTI